MSRGRPRVLDPTIPAHIDPRRLPKGAYWDRGTRTWYTILRSPAPKRKTLCDASATLADLHRALEDLSASGIGTVAWLLDHYHASMDFAGLAESTRGAYQRLRKTVADRPTRAGRLGTLRLSGLTRPALQTLVEAIAKEGAPSKANHILAYLRLVFRWALNHGRAPANWTANPADGVKAAPERRQFKMPTRAALDAVLAFAREGAARKAHARGSIPPYLWAVMELAYRCRLRGIEVITITDAHATPAGIRTNRRKGSRDNIVAWSDGLREAWEALVHLRAQTCARARSAVPLRAEDRVLVVGRDGRPLSKSGLDTAWQRLMAAAIDQGVLTEGERFSLHGLKHRGITDTPGNAADKQTAAGHRTPQMTERYNHAVPVSRPAGED